MRLIDRDNQAELFFFMAAWILMISLLGVCIGNDFLVKSNRRIARLEQQLKLAQDQEKLYGITTTYAKDYRIDLRNSGNSLAIARSTERAYRLAIEDIIHRFNPRLSYQDRIKIADVIYHESLDRQFNPLEPTALATVESEFNPNAKSYAGAYGLMQLTPETGKECAKYLGIRWEGIKTLLNPELNIRMGMVYLYGLRRAHPNLYLVGYNGGPQAIQTVEQGQQHESLNYHRWVASRYSMFRRRYGR